MLDLDANYKNKAKRLNLAPKRDKKLLTLENISGSILRDAEGC